MEDWQQVAETSPLQPLSAAEFSAPTVAGVALEPVPLATFRPQSPVPVSLYLRLDEDMVLCRRRGELLDAMLRRHLLEVGKDRLWTPAATRYEYLSHLQELVIDLLLELIPDEDRCVEPLTWLQPWISRLNRSTPQHIERAWRTAFYGARLAESGSYKIPILGFCKILIFASSKIPPILGLDLSDSNMGILLRWCWNLTRFKYLHCVDAPRIMLRSRLNAICLQTDQSGCVWPDDRPELTAIGRLAELTSLRKPLENW